MSQPINDDFCPAGTGSSDKYRSYVLEKGASWLVWTPMFSGLCRSVDWQDLGGQIRLTI